MSFSYNFKFLTTISRTDIPEYKRANVARRRKVTFCSPAAGSLKVRFHSDNSVQKYTSGHLQLAGTVAASGGDATTKASDGAGNAKKQDGDDFARKIRHYLQMLSRRPKM
eukprot:5472592-Pleurochrysis_carterae.AAC.5